MKTLLSLSKLFLIAGIAVSFAACNKNDSSSSHPHGGKISLTEPAPHTGDVPDNPEPDPVPQVADIYKPFVGVWKISYRNKTFIFLPDGRVAATEDGELSNIGYYYPSGTTNWYYFKWVLADEERNYLKIEEDNTLSLMIDDYERAGDANDAEQAYNKVYADVQEYAQQHNAQFPTGAIATTEANEYDPQPGNIIPGATVFTSGSHFQASFTSTRAEDMPDGKVEQFDGYSRTDVWLMPNGRFFMQLWLWDGVNPADRMESYTHEFSWGKYTVIKGNDVIKGDIINFYYDTGESAAYRTTVGQTNFLTKEVMYVNK